ncbi:hypothetical protein [Hydrocarboniphaga effusa]|uniref:hypothetical protein n=1 Tax=Hydrocarboniphaga effusa TaxID=243629 RepID=UPI003BACD01B
MLAFNSVFQDALGNGKALATIKVYLSGPEPRTLATIYRLDGSAVNQTTNPIKTNVRGQYGFRCADATIDIEGLAVSGETFQLTGVEHYEVIPKLQQIDGAVAVTKAAADSAGLKAIFASYNLATPTAVAGIGALANGDWFEIAADERLVGSPRTRAQKIAGSFGPAINMDQLRVDLAGPQGAALAGYRHPASEIETVINLLTKLSRDVNHVFDHIPPSEHNNILNRTPSMDVSSCLTKYIAASVEGEQINFGRGLMIACEVEYTGRRKYRGENRESCTIRAPDGVTHRGVFRADRLVRSNQALGRPVHFQHMTIDAGADQGASGPGIALCNYRPKLSDMTIRKSTSNLILMPNTMDNGVVITFDAVGAMLISLRLEQAGGDVIKCEGGNTYSDGYAYDLSISGGRNVASLGVGSGWFWNKIHPDSIRNGGFVIDTASTLTINDVYMESHGSSPDTSFVALVSINACRSHGIVLTNIRGRNNGGVAGVTYAFASLRAATNEIATVTVSDCDYEMKADRANIGFVLASATGGSLHLKARGNTLKNVVRPIRRDGTASWDVDGGNSWDRGSSPPVAATVDGVIAYRYAGDEFKNTPSGPSNIDKWVATASGNPATWKPQFRDQAPNWAVERPVDGAGPFSEVLGPYKLGRRRQAVGDLVIHMSKFGTDVERCFYSAKLIVKSKEASDPVTRYLKNVVAPTGFSVAPTISVSGTADAFYVTVAFTPTNTGGDGDGSVTWDFVTSSPQ